MSATSSAELYFIAAMMILILIACVAALYLFFKTYRKEMAEKTAQRAERTDPKADDVGPTSEV